jgi:O-antigen ligase
MSNGWRTFLLGHLLHWLVWLFVATAVVGVWAAYDRQAALIKFTLILCSVIVYFWIIGRSWQQVWWLAGLIGGCGTAVALYFLLSHDWTVWPADLAPLTAIGLRMIAIRPAVDLPMMHPNVVAGLIIALGPFWLVTLYAAWQQQRRSVGIAAGLALLAALLGLLMTSSRMAMLALAVAATVWLLWVVSGRLARWLRRSPTAVFGGGLGLLLVAAGLLLWRLGGLLDVIGRYLPGPDRTGSRLDIFQQTLYLIGDMPFTGGGLANFGGHFSQYIRVTPFFIYSYAHNLYLDLALEQGIIGLLLYLALFVGAMALLAWRAWTGPDVPPIIRVARWLTAVTALATLLHGLVDNALYGTYGTPFILLLPALAFWLAQPEWPASTVWLRRYLPALGGGLLLVGLLVFLIWRPQLSAAWWANRGAVEMARQELVDWPTNELDDGRYVERLDTAVSHFETALTHDLLNPTAHYRLGLVAMQRRDFETAVAYFAVAQQTIPDHRGLQKALGYSYAWLGDVETAVYYLHTMDEVPQEVDVYVWWWRNQGRNDLARRAEVVEQILADSLDNDY